MAECQARGWHEVDVVFVSGDAYVDHPSFAAALLGRVLLAGGFRVATLPQPAWSNADAFRQFGRPRLLPGQRRQHGLDDQPAVAGSCSRSRAPRRWSASN